MQGVPAIRPQAPAMVSGNTMFSCAAAQIHVAIEANVGRCTSFRIIPTYCGVSGVAYTHPQAVAVGSRPAN